MPFHWGRGIVFRIDMHIHRLIWILCAAAALSPARTDAFMDEWEIDTEQISQAGQEIFEQIAPKSLQKEYEFMSAEDLNVFFSPMQKALEGDDLSALAALEPQARETLSRLRATPATQADADWLAARLDFIEMATEVERALPSPSPVPPQAPLPPHPKAPATPNLPPHPKTSKQPLSPHPKMPQPSVTLPPHPKPHPAAKPASAPTPLVSARDRYAESTQSWIRKLKGRPAPARAAALLPHLKRIFRAEGVPSALVWQAEAESTFNPAARSPAGAAGLFQFMPATAKEYGLSLSPEDERLNALKNARAAAQYLKRLHGRFHSWPLALAAYNCGQGRVSKTLRKQNGTSFADIQHKLPTETRMYVPKIAALIQLRENADLEKL